MEERPATLEGVVAYEQQARRSYRLEKGGAQWRASRVPKEPGGRLRPGSTQRRLAVGAHSACLMADGEREVNIARQEDNLGPARAAGCDLCLGWDIVCGTGRSVG